MNIFMRVVWMLSQLPAFVLKLQQKNLRGGKSIVWKTSLVPQYLLIRTWSKLWIVSLFSASLIVFSIEMGNQYVSSRVTHMNNSVQLEDPERQMLVLFLLIILEIDSLLALKCTSICSLSHQTEPKQFVYSWYKLFRWMFSFHMITEKYYFS